MLLKGLSRSCAEERDMRPMSSCVIDVTRLWFFYFRTNLYSYKSLAGRILWDTYLQRSSARQYQCASDHQSFYSTWFYSDLVSWTATKSPPSIATKEETSASTRPEPTITLPKPRNNSPITRWLGKTKPCSLQGGGKVSKTPGDGETNPCNLQWGKRKGL